MSRISGKAAPLVSAIIPTLNRPELLLRAVRSVLDQSFPGLELIVVVDGPDGASERALETVSDPRLRVIVNPVNLGLAEARNTGIRAAKTPWIAFLDDDDLWLPTKLGCQLKLVEDADPRQTLVVSRFIFRQPGLPDAILPENLPSPDVPLLESLFKPRGGGSHVSTFLCGRQLLLEVPFDKTAVVEDLDWMIRIGMRHGLRLLAAEQALSVYQNHGTAANLLSKIDWRAFLNWGMTYRHVLSRRAYTGFILFRCIPMARMQRRQWAAMPVLLLQILRFGRPAPSALLHFFAQYLVSPSLRRRVGNCAALVRSSAARAA